jgi:hypothetical protein
MIKTALSNQLAASPYLWESSGHIRVSYRRADADLYTIDESIFEIKATGRRQTTHLTAPDSRPLHRVWVRQLFYHSELM